MSTPTVVYDVLEAVIGVVSVTCNSLCLYTIVKEVALHTPHNVFVGHLTAIDAIAGLFIPIVAILSNLKFQTNFHLCVFQNAVIPMLIQVETIMLLFVTIERFVAIRYPIKYKKIVRISNANQTCFVAWGLGSLLGLMPLFGWNYGMKNYTGYCTFRSVICFSYLFYIQFLFAFFCPLIVMISVYGYIYTFVIKRERSRSRRLSIAYERKEDTYRMTKYFLLLVLTFFILKLPLGIIHCMYHFNVNNAMEDPKLDELHFWATVISRIPYMVNPFLYAGSSEKLKTAMLFRIPCIRHLHERRRMRRKVSNLSSGIRLFISKANAHLIQDIPDLQEQVNGTEYDGSNRRTFSLASALTHCSDHGSIRSTATHGGKSYVSWKSELQGKAVY